MATSGIRGVEVDLAGAARGKHGRSREVRVHLPGVFIEHIGTDDAGRTAELRRLDQVDGHVVLDDVDVRRGGSRIDEHPLYLGACDVTRVNDATRAVTAFASQVELLIGSLPD